MYARDLSRRCATTFVILTSCFTVAVYAETILLFYDGTYFWGGIKLLLFCLYFARLFGTNRSSGFTGMLAYLGLGPIIMYGIEEKKRRKTLYVYSSPQRRKPHRKESASPFQLDARTPLLPKDSPNGNARYRLNRIVTFDSSLGANPESENSPRETVVRMKANELFDKDGEIAKAIHQYVLFYIGPQIVGNIARYNSLVAKHDVLWTGFDLRLSGASSYLFWVTSFIGILTFPYYYCTLVLARKRAQAFERLNRIAMEVVEDERTNFDRISNSVLPAVEPAREGIALNVGKRLDKSNEVKESHSLPNNFTGSVWTQRSAFNDLYGHRKTVREHAKPKFGKIN